MISTSSALETIERGKLRSELFAGTEKKDIFVCRRQPREFLLTWETLTDDFPGFLNLPDFFREPRPKQYVIEWQVRGQPHVREVSAKTDDFQ